MTHTIHSPNTPYPSMECLFDALVAPVKLAVLETAVELNMGHILSNTPNVNDIAKKLGIQTDTTGLIHFLDAMVAIGLANKKNNTYSNTDFGTHFFDKNSPVFVGDYIQSMKILVQKNLADMAGIIKNGPPKVPQEDTWQSESRWERAVAHLAIGQRAGMAAIYADLVQKLPEFEGVKKLLDLGGGPGLIGAEILDRLPGAKGVLLELPAIIPLARQELNKQGAAEKISFIAGDYNEVDLGHGYDLIWASHNLYFVKDRSSFFQRIKNALTDNGVFVCVHEGLTHEQTAPASIVLMRLSSALEKEGQYLSFEKGEIAACLKQAGFGRVDSRMIALPSGASELVVARAKSV
ncbi:class I SAM-dependent methyltransferase [uncultured Desulfobacter sp.]|uniref:class I SAM-dependent methyltransferase n=1 Tax=uncultured Desulfobacter sp. TaxID=240139 RepID=UPI0029F4AB27|nr:class I SAM-dependent methyltransferase [uncultured Desulfobacter sp.]